MSVYRRIVDMWLGVAAIKLMRRGYVKTAEFIVRKLVTDDGLTEIIKIGLQVQRQKEWQRKLSGNGK